MPLYILSNAYKKRNKKHTYLYEPGRGLPRRSKPDLGCYLVDPPQEFDEEGKELGPDAQVWKTYVREADQVDGELVDGWNKSMDVNLIFAALFSAISTAFVIESYKNLKQDPADASAQTLLVISQTLSSLANASQPVISTPVPTEEATPFRASASAICVNVLWFLSLSLSVAVTLISMLAKEWCLEFMSGRTGPPGAQARRRQQRWDGLESWRMKEVLMVLPSLIHLSLLLFAIGLCVFLWDVHYGVAIPVVIVTTLSAGVYFACTILPFINKYRDCPYGTILSRLYKQFSSKYTQLVRDNGTQDKTTGRALHWMIVNCETPRSVDVALQSLAGAEKGLPPTMLERCDAWTMIWQRAKSIDPKGEKAESVKLLYERALNCHIPTRMNRGDDKQRLVSLVLGLQGCVNSMIYKLKQLRPLDRNTSILEQCTWIGPELLAFDCDVDLIDGNTPWRDGLAKGEDYNHDRSSLALTDSIVQLLAQHMTGQVETEPLVQSALSICLLLLLTIKIAYSPSIAANYIQRLIQAYWSQFSNSSEHTSIGVDHVAKFESNRATIALLLGALAVTNTDCYVEQSPCFPAPSSGSRKSTDKTHYVEKVVELGWQYLASVVYPDTSSFNLSHYMIHGLIHLLARAGKYELPAELERCEFFNSLLNEIYLDGPPPLQEYNCCLTYHAEELGDGIRTISQDLGELPPWLLKPLEWLPGITYDGQTLPLTPRTYAFLVGAICWECKSKTKVDCIPLLDRFPFPKQSPLLTDWLSKYGIFKQLLGLLNGEHPFGQAFAVAQIWLLLHMSLQGPDRRSIDPNRLKDMLRTYPGIGEDLSERDKVMGDLESRLSGMVDPSNGGENLGTRIHTSYLYRVLECMRQTRGESISEDIRGELEIFSSEARRGINSFVDMEAEETHPSPNNNVSSSNPKPSDSMQPTGSLQVDAIPNSTDQAPGAK